MSRTENPDIWFCKGVQRRAHYADPITVGLGAFKGDPERAYHYRLGWQAMDLEFKRSLTPISPTVADNFVRYTWDLNSGRAV